MEIKQTIKKYALDNARKYGGKPNQGAVIGKLISEDHTIKEKLKELGKEIATICNEVSKLTVEQQIAELEKIAPELLEEKKVVEERKLKPLPNAEKGKVVMRLAPSPSGIMHIGHGVVFALSHLYCEEYQGKLILRLEDTNPEEIYEPAYHMTPEDLMWLTENKIHEVVLQSSRLETYYDHAEKMIAKEAAYVCTCDSEIFRDLSFNKKACPCRNLPVKEQHLRWDKMFVEYEPGQAVVRIKTNIEDPNPAMRDWPALRINHHVHPKTGTKYKVWPLMNFAVAIDDHELGITHTIRGKDMMDAAKKQEWVYKFFGWQAPTHSYIGKIKFEGLEISKRKIKAAIENGKYDDWDDIRLATLAAMKRRGFQPGAFRAFAKDIGLGLNDKVVPVDDFFKSLESHNRDIIDPIANRYFFVNDPVKITIGGAPQKKVELQLHPDDKKRGKRIFDVTGKFLIAKQDYDKIKEGKLYRLMDCYNFVKHDKTFAYDSDELEKYRSSGEGTMHWLPADVELIDVEVLMQSKDFEQKILLKGKGAKHLLNLKEGAIIQFERFGFCKLDKKEKNKLVFWWGHK
ncbi:glutamate--tRNA ligase [Candidatus Woesearchaeota archaeon CG10_big_fil_rev_8_21_14_0_10_37_12]|nr:MAG: glutamate--tRNA ligase [Candidatus Woesearchaeota archaeon CG10_big_fil_rev_8_21_14_0_10_37_12]